MNVTQMPPVHAANLVAKSGNTAYGVDVIWPICNTIWDNAMLKQSLSLVNPNEIPVDLLCYRAHLALIMSLTDMKILTSMAHLLYHPK